MRKNIVVYGRIDCTYCDKAKDFLNQLNEEYQYIDITYWNKEQRESLKQKFNVKTVPVVLVGGKCIGGYSELLNEFQLA